MPRNVRGDTATEEAPRAPHDANEGGYDEDAEREEYLRATREQRAKRDADSDESYAKEQGISDAIGRGRQGFRDHRKNNPGGANFPGKDDKFKVDEDVRVTVRFLDDDFFITYYEHEFFKEFEGEKRQKTFICLGSDCPLCAIGDKPKFYGLINVLIVGRKPGVRLWFATPGPGGKIEDQMDELDEMNPPRKVDDPQFYFQVTKTKGKNGFFEYKISRVKARDLEEDFGIQPLTEREIASYAAEKWTDEFIRITPRAKLLEIAEELGNLSDGG